VPVKIRLKRMGAKKHPVYRVVVANSTEARDGRFIETIGTYDPNVDPPTVNIDEEKALRWLGHGAQPTDTTRALLRKQGLLDRLAAVKAASRQENSNQ
jgi:small subunit ribosomal protein S16